jgi:hypothetical protein
MVVLRAGWLGQLDASCKMIGEGCLAVVVRSDCNEVSVVHMVDKGNLSS